MERVVAVIGSRDYWRYWRLPAALGPQNGYQSGAWADTNAQINARTFMTMQLQSRLAVQDLVISGAAKGPDSVGIQAAKALGCKTREYPAEWDKYGKRAGMLRNTTLAEKADWIIAFWDGKSRGTKDTILKAHALGKRVTVLYPDGRVKENGLGDDDPNGRP